jgi:hypothetical protein
MIAHSPAQGGLARARRAALAASAVTGALAAVGAVAGPQTFFPAYLSGFLFVLELALGCLGLLLIDHVVGGAWSAAIRRPLEAGVATFGWLAALALPLFAGLPWLYAWARPELADAVLQHQRAFFNVPFLAVREALCWGAWVGLSRRLLREGAALEAAPSDANRFALMRTSAVGLVVFALTGSVAAGDWGMAVEPRWVSTVYPMMILTGGLLAALALALVTTWALGRALSAWRAVRPQVGLDLGNVLLTLLMCWAYLAYSQYIIIWAADRPAESVWYAHRGSGAWAWSALGLIGAHFALPFALLLFRSVKRHLARLAAVGAVVLGLHALEVGWLVWPSYPPVAGGWGLLGALAPVAVTAAWAWAYLGALARVSAALPPRASEAEAPAHG